MRFEELYNVEDSEQIYRLSNFIEVNIVNTTLPEDEINTILDSLHEYNQEELEQIKTKIITHQLNPFNEVGRYGLTQRFIWW